MGLTLPLVRQAVLDEVHEALARRVVGSKEAMTLGKEGELENFLTSLPESIRERERIQLARAELLVANDTGPVHLASALKVPVLGLYGPNTPRLYGPLSPKPSSLTMKRSSLGEDDGEG